MEMGFITKDLKEDSFRGYMDVMNFLNSKEIRQLFSNTVNEPVYFDFEKMESGEAQKQVMLYKIMKAAISYYEFDPKSAMLFPEVMIKSFYSFVEKLNPVIGLIEKISINEATREEKESIAMRQASLQSYRAKRKNRLEF